MCGSSPGSVLNLITNGEQEHKTSLSLGGILEGGFGPGSSTVKSHGDALLSNVRHSTSSLWRRMVLLPTTTLQTIRLALVFAEEKPSSMQSAYASRREAYADDRILALLRPISRATV